METGRNNEIRRVILEKELDSVTKFDPVFFNHIVKNLDSFGCFIDGSGMKVNDTAQQFHALMWMCGAAYKVENDRSLVVGENKIHEYLKCVCSIVNRKDKYNNLTTLNILEYVTNVTVSSVFNMLKNGKEKIEHIDDYSLKVTRLFAEVCANSLESYEELQQFVSKELEIH